MYLDRTERTILLEFFQRAPNSDSIDNKRTWDSIRLAVETEMKNIILHHLRLSLLGH